MSTPPTTHNHATATDPAHRSTPAWSPSQRRDAGLAAATLTLAALLAIAGFTALGSVFGYPQILHEPVEEILAQFRQHQTAVISGSGCSSSAQLRWLRPESGSAGSPAAGSAGGSPGSGWLPPSCRSSGYNGG